MVRPLAAALLLFALEAAARAEPPSAEKCTAAYDSTQRLRQAGKLQAAETEALVCADSACPRVLRQDCARWVEEIQRAAPTIVVRATGSDGCDIVDARVVLDGKVVASRVEGTPLALDPGVHVVRVEPAAGVPLEQRVVIVEGDRARRIELGATGAVCGVRPDVRAEHPAAAADRPTPPLAYGLGAAGIAAIVGGSVLAVVGFSKRSDLDACKPGCDPDDVGAARRTFVVSDVLFGVGVVALAAAAYVYVTRPYRSPVAAFRF
jgi:hypothetical protein